MLSRSRSRSGARRRSLSSVPRRLSRKSSTISRSPPRSWLSARSTRPSWVAGILIPVAPRASSTMPRCWLTSRRWRSGCGPIRSSALPAPTLSTSA
ncbi:hypothetical protein QQ73_21420 [Candidatus Endoriftia persephone str. Guaymas]|nr:hypothetical protein [Candidatus Endoriftia persephone str. Guaymas]